MKTTLWSHIRAFVRDNPHCWWALYLPVYLILYLIVESVVDGSGPYWSSWCPLDDRIPFLPYFVVAYCSWHPIMILVGLWLLFRDGSAFRRYMQFIAIGFTASTLICFLIPNGQDLRPAVFENPNIFTAILSGIYRADTNTNVFPSVHVIGCLALIFTALDSAGLKKVRMPLILWSFVIIASTVFVKQHSILDVFGAIVLCIPIAAFLWYRRRKEQPCEEREKERDG